MDSDSSSDGEPLTSEKLINELETWLKEKSKKGQQKVSGDRWEKFVAFYMRWVYEPPGSTDQAPLVVNNDNACKSFYSEVKWTGGSHDGKRDVTCKEDITKRNVIVQCKRSNDKVPHDFLKSELADKLKKGHMRIKFTTGIAAVFPSIANRNTVFNILQEINDKLRNDSKFILLEEWETTDKSLCSIRNKLKQALDLNQNLLEFFADRLDEEFPVGPDNQPLPKQAVRRAAKRRRGG